MIHSVVLGGVGVCVGCLWSCGIRFHVLPRPCPTHRPQVSLNTAYVAELLAESALLFWMTPFAAKFARIRIESCGRSPAQSLSPTFPCTLVDAPVVVPIELPLYSETDLVDLAVVVSRAAP